MSLDIATSLVSIRAPSFVHNGGREELRVVCLKPYWLKLRSTHGAELAEALFSTAGLPPSLLDDDNAWISVAAAKRALDAIETALGEGALESLGELMTHPDMLSVYVHMLRTVSEPADAYRYLCQHAPKGTRVGFFEYSDLSPSSLHISYLPDEDDDSPQDDAVFCRMRQGVLRALPRLWDLPDADVKELGCIADGDDACIYEVSWARLDSGRTIASSALAGLCTGAIAAALGNLPLAGFAAISGSALSVYAARAIAKRRRKRAMRAVKLYRITALEHRLRAREDRSSPPGDLRGRILGGKYRISHQIGAGGAGVVLAAEHIALGSQVAVKLLRGAAARNASEIARLRREAQVQVSIEHPNVVRTFDLDTMPDGSIYVVMELLRGESLAERLAREGAISWEEGISAFIDICRALAAAHERGIVHRDMKPGNIFLCENGTAKVLDFGMSKFASAESLTLEGYTLGTPEYMAPEQCTGAKIETRTDIYALGVLIYEALTGELPIQAHERHELLDLHPHAEPRPMRDARPDLSLPAWLDDIVMRALAKAPRDRPSARELEEILRKGILREAS